MKNLELAQFVQTNRGGRKLVYKGYSFTQNRKFNEAISWKCTKYKKWKCHARAVTRVFNDNEYMKISKSHHTHPTDAECKSLKFEKTIEYE